MSTIGEVIPSEILAQLPPIEHLRSVVSSNIIVRPAGIPLVRAAWNNLSVWPDQIAKVYRFGPPEITKTASGFPFFWIYAADEEFTAAWEAQFCQNDAMEPGRFRIHRDAIRVGILAKLKFTRPLKLFDLSGDVVSKMGLYDILRSPDYDLTKCLGYLLHAVIAERSGEIDGFCYPSRRHPGRVAYAISSTVRDNLLQHLDVTTMPFETSDLYHELLHDPSYLP